MAKPGKVLALAATLSCLMSSGGAFAEEKRPIPHLSDKGLDGYREYQAEQTHKAFAIAPGGAWAWRSGQPSRDLVLDQAVASCEQFTEQTCVAYDIDDDVVFDADNWTRLWGPYLSEEKAAQAEIGTFKGERFPDMRFTAPDGTVRSIAELRGKVVILHFWGSWCPPCREEMPAIEHFYQSVAGRDDVEMILLQGREGIKASRAWAARAGIKLPLYDSGVGSRKDVDFVLADGSKVADRILVPTFPTSYVLDRRGIVVFSIEGAMSDHPGYLPLINDVAARSGR